MEINYRSATNSFNANEILYHVQTLTDAFAEALKQNNCIVMLPISLHNDIDVAIKDLEESYDLNTPVDLTQNPVGNAIGGEKILESIQSAIDYSKAQCYSCALTLPRIDFTFDTSMILGT